jgi:deoxyribodipyrimidine photo-lyase
MSLNKSNKQKIVIYWCRRDFRLNDNPALFEANKFAKKENLNFLPIFILDQNILNSSSQTNKKLDIKIQTSDFHPNIGYPRRYFLSKILAKFSLEFPTFLIFLGDFVDIFEKISNKFEVFLFANDDVEPYSKVRDSKVKEILDKNQGKFFYFIDQLSVNKDLTTQNQKAYSVFTPFKKAVWQEFLDARVYEKVNTQSILGIDKKLFLAFKELKLSILNEDLNQVLNKNLQVLDLQSQIFRAIDKKWIFEVKTDSDEIFEINLDEILTRPNLDFWADNENETLQNFENFLETKILDYQQKRNYLDCEIKENTETDTTSFTSKMSVALKWGLVSSRKLKQMILTKYSNQVFEGQSGVIHYISELIWREFYRYILNIKPLVLNQEFQIKFQNKLIWQENDLAKKYFLAWIKGQTGYPIVDAGMNEISNIAWMHNRSRMIVASVLTKNFGINWRWGQEYFRAILLDLDEASNNGGWQWSASVGSDPKPIRIFNPYLQAQNYDKNCNYQKKWLPQESFLLPKKDINWELFNKNPEIFYAKKPIIEHKLARNQALERYKLSSKL